MIKANVDLTPWDKQKWKNTLTVKVEGGGIVSKAKDRKSGTSNSLVPRDLLMDLCGQSTDGLYCHTGKPWSGLEGTAYKRSGQAEGT